MWNNWLDKGAELAQKAKEAAAAVEAQLNDSVGVEGGGGGGDGPSSRTVTTTVDDDDDDDDSFYDDEHESDFMMRGNNNNNEQHRPLSTVPESSLHELLHDDGTGDVPETSGVFRDDADEEGDSVMTDEEEGAGWNMEDDDIMLSQEEEEDDHLADVDIEEKEDEDDHLVVVADDMPPRPSMETQPKEPRSSSDTDTHGDHPVVHDDISHHEQCAEEQEQRNVVSTETLDQSERVNTDLHASTTAFFNQEALLQEQEEFISQHDDSPVVIDNNNQHTSDVMPSLSEDMNTTHDPYLQKLPESWSETPNIIPEYIEPSDNTNHVQSNNDDGSKDDTSDPPSSVLSPNITSSSSSLLQLQHPSQNSLAQSEDDPSSAPLEDIEHTTPDDAASHQPEKLTPVVQEQDNNNDGLVVADLRAQLDDLRTRLHGREEQLTAHADNMAALASLHEQEKETLQAKVREIKEEAKRRVQRAKDKADDAVARVRSDQDAVIKELRSEGETLAKSQGKMEQNYRQARSEVRDRTEALEALQTDKAAVEERLAASRSEVADLRRQLDLSHQEQQRAGVLSQEMFAVKEQSQQHEAVKLSLEREIKDLKKAHQDRLTSMSKEQQGKLEENTLKHLRIHNDKEELMIDMETKLRKSEREANLREDALRREVEELRKRWQDAVRRADALSMDVQQSTAPLMRQLESTERQNRARASAWAELEENLRSELEKAVIGNERGHKIKSELQTKCNMQERRLDDKSSMLDALSVERDGFEERLKVIQTELEETESERRRLQEECARIERLANDDSKQIRNEMMLTIITNEERFAAEIDELTNTIARDREERADLEEQLDSLVRLSSSAHHNNVEGQHHNNNNDPSGRRLSSFSNQASILEDTLIGLDNDAGNDDADVVSDGPPPTTNSGFVAMEHLSQSLRASKLELEALRKQLVSSERARESLSDALSSARNAVDKLPLFENKVAELTSELREKNLDIAGLRDDVLEIKEMYRTQLDSLLEEQALNTPVAPRRPVVENKEANEDVFSTPSDFAAANFDISYSG